MFPVIPISCVCIVLTVSRVMERLSLVGFSAMVVVCRHILYVLVLVTKISSICVSAGMMIESVMM